MARVPTRIEPLYRSDDDFDEQFSKLRDELAELHELLYADGRYGVLVIFQGMDASGKDGAIKHVISGLNPQGVNVSSFRAPSDEEARHGFLHRAQLALPSRGKIGIFNRSYYEEVVTVRVHPEYLEKQRLPVTQTRLRGYFDGRFDDIRNFESYLSREGYLVIKFFLHISMEEQKERLLKRIDQPEKNWKFDPSDLRDRANWRKYRAAYDDALTETATPQTPWVIIPADDKKNARLMICQVLVERLRELPLRYPPLSDETRRELARVRRELAGETRRSKRKS